MNKENVMPMIYMYYVRGVSYQRMIKSCLLQDC